MTILWSIKSEVRANVKDQLGGCVSGYSFSVLPSFVQAYICERA
ncbi:MAG TPA: hypothetical protein VEY70_10335 [Metabacillus sp.]|nr:hypothetical protein [Metabacillus sp.]